MKFDLLYELQMPKPHDERSEYRCYHEALEQIVLADRLGFDTVWEVEHHFLTEFAHSSAPEVFLSAVAQHTKRIRIGHGVVLLPHQFNHPIRVAERVAALDIMSDGRVEFGTGRSSQYEQGGFEINTDLSRDMWQESLEIIPRMWTESPFEYRGRFVNIPPRDIIPKPLQKPHPPIWMAATSPQSWEIAGRNGIGILGLTIFVSVPQLTDRVRAYRTALKAAKPVGRFVNDKVGAFTTGSANCATPVDHLRTLPFYFADVRSDPTNNADLGLAKNIAVREGMRIQLRLEFINAFNHPMLNSGGLANSQVVVNPASSTFGQTVSSNQQNYARRAQFMAKFIF